MIFIVIFKDFNQNIIIQKHLKCFYGVLTLIENSFGHLDLKSLKKISILNCCLYASDAYTRAMLICARVRYSMVVQRD